MRDTNRSAHFNTILSTISSQTTKTYQKPREINIRIKVLVLLKKHIKCLVIILCMLVFISSIKFYHQHTPHKHAYHILNLCNASKHMKMHISNANNQVHELAPPTCVLLLSKNFLSSFILQCCSLFVHVQLLRPHDAFTYLCSNFSPFVINFHKRCASY